MIQILPSTLLHNIALVVNRHRDIPATCDHHSVVDGSEMLPSPRSRPVHRISFSLTCFMCFQGACQDERCIGQVTTQEEEERHVSDSRPLGREVYSLDERRG